MNRTKIEQQLIIQGFICKIEGEKSTYLNAKTGKIAVFENGNLISPLPRIYSNGVRIKHHQTILDVIRRYDHESVVEAMFNNKITLTT